MIAGFVDSDDECSVARKPQAPITHKRPLPSNGTTGDAESDDEDALRAPAKQKKGSAEAPVAGAAPAEAPSSKAAGKAPAAAEDAAGKPKAAKKPALKYKDMSPEEQKNFDDRKAVREYNKGVKKNDAYRVANYNRAIVKLQTMNEALTSARIRNKKQRKKETKLLQLVREVLIENKMPTREVDGTFDEVDKRLGAWIDGTLNPMDTGVKDELGEDEFVLPFDGEEYQEEAAEEAAEGEQMEQ